MKLLSELKRRNVIRMAAIYVIIAWGIMQVTEVLAGLTELPDWVGPAVLTAIGVGFPIALFFSWFYELTPEGIATDIDGRPGKVLPGFTGRLVDFVVIAILCAAVLLFAYDKWWVTKTHEHSIAVLPFTNMSPESDTEYFSDGISEELLNVLTQLPGLRVAARTSSFYFKDRDVPIPEIADALKVAYVLEGSVRKSGDKVRVTAQLVDGKNGYHLWSDAYDRNLDDIFLIQDDIAARIARELELNLESEPPATRSAGRDLDIEAYDLYLEGRELIKTRKAENLEAAIRLLKQSLRLDGNFAPAHAQLAIALMLSAIGESTIEAARYHLDTAQELDPHAAEVLAGKTLMALNETDPAAAIEHATRALELMPNYSDVMNWQQMSYRMLGKYVEADKVLEQLLLVDPLNLPGRLNHIKMLSEKRQLEAAHREADRLMRLDPNFGRLGHAQIYLYFEGELAAALNSILLAEIPNKLAEIYTNVIFIAIGEMEEARRFGAAPWTDLIEGDIEEAVRATRRDTNLNPHLPRGKAYAASMLMFTGQFEEARQLLESAHKAYPAGRPIDRGNGPYFSMLLAWLRRQAGDEVGARELAEIVRQDLSVRTAAGRRSYDESITAAMLAAFEGDTDASIAAMRTAIDRGWRQRLLFEHPITRPIADNPEVIALKERLNAILAAEHRKVLELICFNNPTPNTWRPLPETCEGVVPAA